MGNGSVNENKGYNLGLEDFRPHLNHKGLCQEATVLHSNSLSMSPTGSQSLCVHHSMTWRAKAARHPSQLLGPSFSLLLGQREGALQLNPPGPVLLAKEEGGMFPMSCCSLRDEVVPLLSFSGFVSTAIESLTITFSPT